MHTRGVYVLNEGVWPNVRSHYYTLPSSKRCPLVKDMRIKRAVQGQRSLYAYTQNTPNTLNSEHLGEQSSMRLIENKCDMHLAKREYGTAKPLTHDVLNIIL